MHAADPAPPVAHWSLQKPSFRVASTWHSHPSCSQVMQASSQNVPEGLSASIVPRRCASGG
jgi:hypothetical protein